jgi:hypothetical protein
VAFQDRQVAADDLGGRPAVHGQRRDIHPARAARAQVEDRPLPLAPVEA